MNAVTTVEATPTPVTAPFKVDVSKGSHDGSVSNQWATRPADQRFVDLDALHDFKKNIYDNAWEKRVSSNKFDIMAPEVRSLDDTNILKIGVNNVRQPGADIVRDVVVDPTHWSFGQMCQLASAPAHYLRTIPTQIVADALTYSMRYSRNIEEVKLYGDTQDLMAATGPEYGRIPDYQVIDAIRKIAGKGLGGDGFHWKTPGTLNWENGTYDPEDMGDVQQRTFYASDRDMFVFLVDDRRPIVVGTTRDGHPDHMFRGFIVQNSEVGARSMKIIAFYLRGVCMNRNLWGCEGFDEIRINHTKMAPDRWITKALPALESFAGGSERTLKESVEKVKAAQIAETKDEALAFLQNRGFSRRSALDIYDTHEHEEARPIKSAWDVAQGITAYARNTLNNDDRLKMELEAKKVLDKVTGPGRVLNVDENGDTSVTAAS